MTKFNIHEEGCPEQFVHEYVHTVNLIEEWDSRTSNANDTQEVLEAALLTLRWAVEIIKGATGGDTSRCRCYSCGDALKFGDGNIGAWSGDGRVLCWSCFDGHAWRRFDGKASLFNDFVEDSRVRRVRL